MSWLLLSLVCVLGWGAADLFYKLSTDREDGVSHLKLAFWVGLVMGVCALALLPFSETLTAEGANPASVLRLALRYAPASISYIVSMVIGYAGLRYLELSVVSPLQNASGALSALCMVLFFSLTGRGGEVRTAFSAMELAGTALVVVGVILLAVAEQTLSRREKALPPAERKYRFGALALLFPLAYCVFDTVGTAADGILLDGSSPLGLGEIDVLVLYGLTFFVAGLAAWIALCLRRKRAWNPFARREWPCMAAACCEQFGQIFYVYAMAARPVLAAPVVASYCIVSLLLSRWILKERLTPSQYVCVALVVAGIVLLGIAEGLAS